MKLFGVPFLLFCVCQCLLNEATEGTAVSCTLPVEPSSVDLNRLPVVYPTGTSMEFPNSNCIPQTGPPPVTCQPTAIALGDGVKSSGNLNTMEAFTLDGDVDIKYSFSTANTVNLVNLYFYNEPSAEVGLPIITLTDPSLDYVILGNEDVNQSDSQYRSISLIVMEAPNDITFTISLSFQSTTLSWAILSEIELCSNTVSIPMESIEFADTDRNISLDPISSFNLSCTVTNQGFYNWEWSLDGNPFTPDSMWLSDTTRTSTISVTDGSLGTYQCEASSGIGTGAQTITVNTPAGSVTPVSTTPSPSPPTTSDSPPPSPPPSPPTGSSNIAAIAGGAAGGAVVAIAIITVILILCCCVYKRKRKGSADIDGKGAGHEPFYAELHTNPPPLPERSYPYASIDTLDATEKMDHVDVRRSQASLLSETDGSPMPIKLLHPPGVVFQQNPMYTSADNLTQDHRYQTQRRQFGSVPSSLDSPNQSFLDIYASTSVQVQSPSQTSSPQPALDSTYSEANLSPAVFRASTTHVGSPSGTSEPLCPYASIYADPRPLRKSEGPMELTHQNIRESRVLGTGQFGQVVLAETVGVSLKDLKLSDSNDDKGITIQVAVKKLKRNPTRAIKEAFEKEIKFMSRLKDDNVVCFLGICSTENPFIVMEYMENGDLNQYLHKHEFASPDTPQGDNQLPASILLQMCIQISSGMRYLAFLHFVHRDLATRNCLVGQNNIVKIADFGMSRSLYSSDYYRIRGRAMLPIRWMANECFYGRFSEKTDVWAFGVTMWEVFTFAKRQPYEEMTDQEVIDDSIKGSDRTLLSKPDICPQEIYEVMLRCWVHEPDERADFEEIHSSLSSIHSYSLL